MSKLEGRLDTINKTCAPARNDDCLHKALEGLTVLEMGSVMSEYMQGAVEKNLPNLSFEDLLKGTTTLNANAPGNSGMYKFEKK